MKKPTPHILIAEDESFLASMMRSILEAHGVRVSVARNGEEVLKVLSKDLPTLLLLDLLMPVLDGYGVLKMMKEKKIGCPVVIMSNLGDQATINKCKAFGIQDYFIKSEIDDDTIWKVVQNYLV